MHVAATVARKESTVHADSFVAHVLRAGTARKHSTNLTNTADAGSSRAGVTGKSAAVDLQALVIVAAESPGAVVLGEADLGLVLGESL